MTDAQVLSVFAAASRANDFAYIFDKLTPKPDADPDEPRMGIDALVHYLVVRLGGAHTHESLRALPLQEVLAIADLQNDLDNPPGRWDPVSGDDPNADLLRAAGYTVN